MDKRKKHRESSEATCRCLGAMKPKVIITDKNMKMFHTVFEELEAISNFLTTENDEEETLRKEVEDADLLIVSYAQVTRKVLKSAKKLKGVLKWGVGVDSIDLDAATERRIPVVHCPSYGSDTVADHAFGLMIALARKIIDYDREMREKSWMWPSTDHAGIDLSGKKSASSFSDELVKPWLVDAPRLA